MEDQDFSAFGLFRDVNLYGLPKIHVADMWAKASWRAGSTKRRVGSDFKNISGNRCGSCGSERRDLSERGRAPDFVGEISMNSFEIQKDGTVRLAWKADVPEPVRQLDNRDPKLYRLEIRILDPDGNVAEVVPYDVGFRKICMQDGLMELNGERLIINGVNRHEVECNPRGRSISEEDEISTLRA